MIGAEPMRSLVGGVAYASKIDFPPDVHASNSIGRLDAIRLNDGLACAVGDLVLNVREALAFHRVPDRAGHGCVL
jgi:hypothetical protein